MNDNDALVFQRTWKTLFHVILLSFWLILLDQAWREKTSDVFWFTMFAWVQFYLMTFDWNNLRKNPLNVIGFIAIFGVMMITFVALHLQGELGGMIGLILEVILLWSWVGKYLYFWRLEKTT